MNDPRDSRPRDKGRERSKDGGNVKKSNRRERDSDEEVDSYGSKANYDDKRRNRNDQQYNNEYYEREDDYSHYDESYDSYYQQGGEYDVSQNEQQRYGGYPQHRQDRPREREPSPSIMIRGLKLTTTGEMITDTLKAFGALNAVRLIRNKQTGEPRGFAFVDFVSLEDAKNLMAYQNKTVFIDGRTVMLDYSNTPPPPSSSGGGFKDWLCPQCSASNFARRSACYSCGAPKPANPLLAPQHEDVPSSSLIVKGLSPVTTDESIHSALSMYSQVKEVRLVRDKQTGASRCFAFVEFYNVDEATYVLGTAANSYIDGQQIRLSYARSMDNVSNHHSQSAQEQAAWMAYNQQYSNQNQPSLPPEGFVVDPVTGFYHNAATGYYYDDQTKRYMYYDEKTQQYMCYDQASNSYTPYNPSGRPRPVTPSHISSDNSLSSQQQQQQQQQTQQTQQQSKTTRSVISAAPTTTIIKSAEPVISIRVVNPTATSTSTPSSSPSSAPVSSSPTPLGSSSTPPASVPTPQGPVKMTLKETKPKKNLTTGVPGIFAKKKISKEVERWNQKGKELSEEEPPATRTSTANTTPLISPKVSIPSPSPSPSPSSFSNIEPTPSNHLPTTNFSSSSEGTSGGGSEQQDAKPICLLCKRQFKSLEQLQKHETLSELHKANLELARQKQALAKEEIEEEKQNHKRAREEWSGDTNNNATPTTANNSNNRGKVENAGGALGESNIGYQMLKNFGWKEGGGLGKTGDGMTAPIEVYLRADRAGLGADQGSSDPRYAVNPNDSYKEATRKKALSRFEAITNINVAEVNAAHPFLKKRGRES